MGDFFSLERILMENFLKNQIARVLAWIGGTLISLSILIVGNGKIETEIPFLPTDWNWGEIFEVFCGVLLLSVGFIVFWFITP